MEIPRFYPILDTATAARHGLDVLDAARMIVSAGARILQFRHKSVFDRRTFTELEQIAELCRRSGVMLVVNDRADIARIFNAALHLGQEDLTPSEARCVTGPGACIGYSTHNEDQFRAAAAEPADYLAFGPIFGTQSKENPDPVVGLNGLRRMRALTNRPLVAIGGITRENAKSAIEAGTDSVAVIGDLFPDVATRAAEFMRLLGECTV